MDNEQPVKAGCFFVLEKDNMFKNNLALHYALSIIFMV